MYPAPPVTRTLPLLASNGEIREAERTHVLGRVEVAAVEYDRRPEKGAHLVEVGLPELVPLRHDRQRVGTDQRVVALLAERDVIFEDAARRRPRFRIVGAYRGAELQQPIDDRDGRRLAHVI